MKTNPSDFAKLLERSRYFRDTGHIRPPPPHPEPQPLTDQEIQRRAVVAASGLVKTASKAFLFGFLAVVLIIFVMVVVATLGVDPQIRAGMPVVLIIVSITAVVFWLTAKYAK